MKLDLQTGAAPPGTEPGASLTQAALLNLEYFEPAEDIAPFVTTFFRMRCDEPEIRDVQPASVGILAVTARGQGHMRFLDGRCEPSHRLLLLTPTSAAALVEMTGPWHTFGAALSPLGWAALTGLSASEHANRIYDGAAMLPPVFGEAAERIARSFETMTPDEMVALFAQAVASSLRPVPADHLRLIATVRDWLGQSFSPQVSALAARAGMSQRQVQRLVDRYFGLPPKALARKYRALRAAALLSSPTATADDIAAVTDHFYDQSHMIRELRLFAGRTPSRIGNPDTPYLSAMLDLRNFREIRPRIAPIPQDLRA